MNDDHPPGKAPQQEPSMDDILASIRRILAEEKGAEPLNDREMDAEALPPETEPPPPAEPVVGSEPLVATAAETPRPVFREVPAPPPSPSIEESMAEAETEVGPQDREDEIFDLTPAMRTAVEHVVVSRQSADNATDVLAQLAEAILDRRDIVVGGRGVTLEGMVRAMLRPLLQEWLDRNLPYLIERLVKREIDLMVNRAERLE